MTTKASDGEAERPSTCATPASARRSRGRPNTSTTPASTPKKATFLIAHRPRWTRSPAKLARGLEEVERAIGRQPRRHEAQRAERQRDRAGDRSCSAHGARVRRSPSCSATSQASTRNTVDSRQPIASANRTPGQHPVVATGGHRAGQEQPERPREVAERGRGDPEPRVGGQHEHRPARPSGSPRGAAGPARPTARAPRTARWPG